MKNISSRYIAEEWEVNWFDVLHLSFVLLSQGEDANTNADCRLEFH